MYLLSDLIAALGQFPGLRVLYLESYYKPFIFSIAAALLTHGPSDLSVTPTLAFLTTSITPANETAQLRGDSMSSIDPNRTDLARSTSDNNRRFQELVNS